MRARARFLAASQTLLLLATLVLPGLAAATEIYTDLWIYQDGDTVTVTGIDFGATEVVDFVSTDPVGTVVDTGSATTDAGGGVVYQFVLHATMSGIYDIVATGRTSGLTATTQFDPPNVGFTIAAPSPTTVAYSDLVTLNGAYTCVNTGGPDNNCTATSGTETATFSVKPSGSGGFTTVGSVTSTFSFPAGASGCPSTCSVPFSLTWKAGRDASLASIPPGVYDVRVASTIAGGNPTLSGVLTIAKESTSTSYSGATTGLSGTTLALSASVQDADLGLGAGNGLFSPDVNLAGTGVVTFQLFNAANTVPVSSAISASIGGGGSTTGSPSLTLPATAGSYVLRTTYSGAGIYYSGSADTDTITVNSPDSSPPVITKTVTGTLGLNGWYTSDVTVDWTLTDAESSFTLTGCVDQTLSDDTLGTTLSCSATSAGGTASDAVTIKIDQTAPTVTVTPDRAPDSTTWYAAPVVFDTAGTDATSGVVDADCTADATYSGPGGIGITVSGTCTDGAGNVGTGESNAFKYDDGSPIVTITTPDDAADPGTGWYNIASSGLDGVLIDVATSDDVQVVELECTVNGSDVGPLDATGDSFVVFSGVKTIECQALDDAENTGTDSETLDIDQIAPGVNAGEPNRAHDVPDWYNAPVDIVFTGVDETSGIDACTTISGYDTDGIGIAVFGTCTDNAGNTGEPNNSVLFNYDNTDPYAVSGSPNRPTDHNGWYNAPVDVVFTGADDTSGIDACTTVAGYDTDGENVTVPGSCTDVAGNTSATVDSAAFDYDNTNPVITFQDRTPLPNFFGWANVDVLLTWGCTDTTSGAVDATVSNLETGEGESQSSTQSCSDNAGNTSSDTQTGVSIDKTDPVITFDGQTPSANVNGWNNTPVTLDWSCTDALSGVLNATLSETLSDEGADQSVTATCYDEADNSDADTQTDIDIDLTAPLITFLSRTPANGNGWNDGDVTVTWTCFDALSGAEAGTVSQTVTTEGANQSATGTCTDLAGNAASDTQTGINIDTTDPTITFASRLPAANANGWNNAAVTVTWNCADALSGPVAATNTDAKSAEGAGQVANGSCADLAGNSSSSSQGGINIDLTAPTAVAFGDHGLTEGASYVFGSVPAGPATCAADFDISGSAGCVVTGYGTAVGSHTVLATATDQAGNVGTAAIHYTVLAWTLSGYYAPVDMGGYLNVVKAGSTVPLKFEIFAGTTERTSVADIKGFRALEIACGSLVWFAADDIEITSTGGTSLRYDSTGGQFIQNWQTPKNKAGSCWAVTMTADDGSSINAFFRLK